MGEECSTCRICTDQEEIRAESTIENNPIITNKNEKDKPYFMLISFFTYFLLIKIFFPLLFTLF